ncbi:host specificity factor TipJ family phage tail protein [Methylobacterium sp. J-092]|uniref:host specificity factor TipJ family phage tail protein n=1 Tax=Methylobacterium sp. J-092 TaxID=2836667 RepID=UPI001FBA5144|nr:host specificity factor TipJ family phage tail protein [Methylobacterium sp. J-092]MCJ2009812.1 gp58-like family protein [Methylobacterium sp. J-092]
MTLVVTSNVVGQRRGEPVVLPNRRRRLSTIVARHRPPADRRFIVSVHRKGEVAFQPNDRAVRLRADWPRTLVGPSDVVLITVVPLKGGFASIGLAIASIALIAIAPYAAPGIAGFLGAGVSAGVVQAGLVVGGIALSFAAQASAAAKKKTENPLYSVSGGGNIPKANARRPLLYGRSWSSPPLSQKDYFSYDGDTMVLVKRMTLGIGKFKVHRVRVGDALYWDEGSGLQSPFNLVTGPLGAAFEILYETPSAISPGDVITSTDVGGQEMPRVGGNPDWTPWFRLCPPGVTADAMQVSHTYPAIYRTSSAGAQKPTVAAVTYQGREIDPNTGNVIGPVVQLWRSDEGGNALTVTPLRRSVNFRLPKPNSAWEVRAQNAYPDPVGFIQENRASWDEMVAFKDDVRIRPQTTEICMRVRAGKGLTVTAFSDITVDATRIVPVWNGSGWVEQPASKAVWAFCDLVRAEYGLNQPDGVDADKALYYANLLPSFDTYDGQLPEVSSFWEAAAEVLQPLRADPVKVGAIHTFVRDESRADPRHVLTRRQIIRDSGGATYKTKVEGSDVIVEFDRDGDPKRPDEVRYSYGPQTRTPKRYKVAGIRDGEHAQKHAAWLALVAVFRGAERRITTEWDGRLVFPGDHILSDLWFFRDKQAYGVASRDGNVLQLDVTANVPGEWGYISIRTRVGREWGILRARGVGARGLELHPDDVPALEAQTGLPLASVLARDTQGPTTVVLGDLTELQESYVARSAVPSDADHVQIEMVRDDIRIWQMLGETVYLPFPVNYDGTDEPLQPQISVLHARCINIETGIEVVWGVSATRGARNYEADITYDQGVTWDILSPFGPASTGRAQMRQVDGPVSVRARAYGRTGLHGDYITTTFTTIAPVVDMSYIDGLEALFTDVRKTINSVAALGDAELRRGLAILLDVNRDLDRRLEEMAQAAATEAGQAFLTRQFNKVAAEGRTQDSFAAIERVDEARISDKEAFAGITTTLGSRLTTAEGTIVGQATALQSVTTRVTNAEGTITSTSQALTNLTSRVTNNELNISGQATATQQLTTRVSGAEGNISSLSQSYTALQAQVNGQGDTISGQATAISNLSAYASQIDGQVQSQASSIQALSTTQAGHTATLTTYGTSINGQSVQFGVTGSIDGQTGGFVFDGVRRLDGAVSYSLKIRGDVIVDGTLTARTLSAQQLIVNGQLFDAAATQVAAAGSGTASSGVSIYLRGSGKTVILAFFNGNSASGSTAGPGQFLITRDGANGPLSTVNASFALYKPDSGNLLYYPGSMCIVAIDNPGTGTFTYRAQHTNGQNIGGVTIVVMEQSK